MKKSYDQFENLIYTIKEEKFYDVQIRTTKNHNKIMVIIPKTEAGKLNYRNQIFIGKLFDNKIKFLGVEFTVDEKNDQLLAQVINENQEEEKLDPDLDVPF